MTGDTTPNLEDWVTGSELAEFLGISERSLSYYRIPHVELGRQKLYQRQEVAQWLQKRQADR